MKKDLDAVSPLLFEIGGIVVTTSVSLLRSSVSCRMRQTGNLDVTGTRYE